MGLRFRSLGFRGLGFVSGLGIVAASSVRSTIDSGLLLEAPCHGDP